MMRQAQPQAKCSKVALIWRVKYLFFAPLRSHLALPFSLSLLPSSPSPVLPWAFLPPLPERPGVWRENLRANAHQPLEKLPSPGRS